MQRRAAWIGRTVSHPNLLPVLSAGVGQPPFYLASPKLEGRTLDRILQDEDNLPLPTKLWIVRQIAEALAALHESTNMIHADVKPGNIFVSPEGHATLIDLGFAHTPNESRHWSLRPEISPSRPVMGTLHYIAPEAITSSMAAEPRSDIYSLGVMFYQMLTRQLPFPTDDASELVRLHREQKLSLANVMSFNLDEYFPMNPAALQSYHRFMHEHLFDRVDIEPSNIHIPDGTLKKAEVTAFCRRYEQAIADAGGIDIQLLGIGRTGHIGFNEPGSQRNSRTRLITLDRVTRKDAASDFFGEQNVPRRAITMGVGTILSARRVILLAFGERKAAVIARTVEGPVAESVAAGFLQEHPDAAVYLDPAAAAELTRAKCPWVIAQVEWDDALIRKAVIWLARQLDKGVLKLTDEDYNEHHLQDLLAEHGPAYEINLRVFRRLQQTITGWPGVGHWLQISGFSFRFDSNRKTATDLSLLTEQGPRAIRPAEKLRAVVNRYLIDPQGDQDGFRMLNLKQVVDPRTPPDLKDLVLEGLKAAGERGIAPQRAGRICDVAQGGPCLLTRERLTVLDFAAGRSGNQN